MNTSPIARILNIQNEYLTNHEFRKYFRILISNNLEELPSVPSIAYGPAIDEGTIIKLNELMSSGQKIRFLKNILSFEDIDFNAYYLILNSSDSVREYIMELLTHSALGMATLPFHFYEIANIYLFVLANSKSYTCIDILQHLKNGMIMYDSSVEETLKDVLDLQVIENNLFSSNLPQETRLPEHPTREYLNHPPVPLYKEFEDILENLKLKTDEQLEEKKNDFFKKVDEQESKKLKPMKILTIFGISCLFQIGLVSLGFPPFTRLVNTAVKTIFNSDN